jgi:hypothetical protein
MKNKLITHFEQNSLWAHMELEFELLGVVGKFVKYLVHLSKGQNCKKIIFDLINCPNNK